MGRGGAIIITGYISCVQGINFIDNFNQCSHPGGGGGGGYSGILVTGMCE